MATPAPSPHEDLIDTLRGRGIADDEVLDVMRRVPRHRFVEPGLRALAYDDRPLPSAHSPPLPQPYIAALVASAVSAGPRRRVLEVGTDSGYMVAILAKLFDEAYTIERHRDVAARAARLFDRLDIRVKLRRGDGGRGWSDHAPFDAIVVMAGAVRPPSALVDQLAEGGTLVVPIGTQPLAQRLTAFTKTPAGLERRDLGPVSFVPLVGAGGWGPEYSVQPVVKTGAGIVEQLRAAAHPMDAITPDGLQVVLDDIGDARVVLLGASTNGTSEFQQVRATLTRALVERHRFDVVAFDTDWAHGALMNDLVQGGAPDVLTAPDATGPWAWHNEETLRFLVDLRQINEARPSPRRVRCYGLDLLAADHAVDELAPEQEQVGPGQLEDAARAFDGVAALTSLAKPVAGVAAVPHTPSGAEAKVTGMLHGLLEARLEDATAGPQHEALMATAEVERATRRGDRFYEALSRRDPSAWLLREEQLADTLDRILSRHDDRTRVVVWAHNVGVGDARATGLGDRRLPNLGQYVRERYGQATYSLGMGAYKGTVVAAAWPTARGDIVPLPPAARKSHEHLCHAAGIPGFFVDLADPRLGFLSSARAQRAIGAAYRPDGSLTEHYLQARLTPQFDGYVWFDQTEAVRPLHREGLEALPGAHFVRA